MAGAPRVADMIFRGVGVKKKAPGARSIRKKRAPCGASDTAPRRETRHLGRRPSRLKLRLAPQDDASRVMLRITASE